MLNWLSKFKTDWLSGEALNEWRIYWQTDFATERGTGWPINYLDDYQIGWWINWKTDCLIDWLIDWLLDQMINWLFSLLTPWPTNWLTDSQVQYIHERYYYFFFSSRNIFKTWGTTQCDHGYANKECYAGPLPATLFTHSLSQTHQEGQLMLRYGMELKYL